MKYLLLLLLTTFIYSQDISEKTEPFTKVDIDLNANTFIEFGETHSIKITGKSKLLRRIEYNINNGKLTIEMKRERGFFSFFNKYDERAVKIVIIMEKMEFLKLNGAGKTDIDEFDADKVRIVINGANDLISGGRIDFLDLDIHGASETEFTGLICEEFTLDIKGAGDLKLSGRTNLFEIDVKGAGDVNGFNFITTILDAKIMGAGDIKLTVTEEIDASIFGAGNITYKGNPARVKDKIFGAGEIEKY